MIRVFIGTDGDIHQDAEKVLEYSIRTNTSQPVDITFMRPGWKNGVTGFTTHRYMIPQLCGYEGYAIYLDVDMIALEDLEDLWGYRTPGKWCTTNAQDDDVSVIDCSAFTDLNDVELLKKAPGGQTKQIVRRQIGNRYFANISPLWNVEDKVIPNAKLIHYTALNTQPWKPNPKEQYKDHPSPEAVDLFFEYLDLANG